MEAFRFLPKYHRIAFRVWESGSLIFYGMSVSIPTIVGLFPIWILQKFSDSTLTKIYRLQAYLFFPKIFTFWKVFPLDSDTENAYPTPGSLPKPTHQPCLTAYAYFVADFSLDVGRRVGGGWIFTHDIANVFFNKHSFCEHILSLTNHLRWLTLRGRGD